MTKPSNVALFQARPRVETNLPDDITEQDVSLLELRELEQALTGDKERRWSMAQRFFFEALLTSPSLDPYEAAKRAGVKPSQASRWLGNAHLQELLTRIATKRLNRMQISQDQIVRNMLAAAEMALGDRPIKKTVYDAKQACFITDSVKETNLTAYTRILELLGKHTGLFTPDDQVHERVTINLDLGSPSPKKMKDVAEQDTTYTMSLDIGGTNEH